MKPEQHLPSAADFFQTRRQFLNRFGMGFGALSLGALVGDRFANTAEAGVSLSPLAPGQSHFTGNAKRVIHIFAQGGRLQLAEDTASADNTLTARVIVNRVWQWHLGKPLVASPGDFGLRSEPPTHPELLDWLASHFRESNWSFKELHRLTLTSATWQQGSLKNTNGEREDPDNNLLWRQNIQRLDFESIRDTLVVLGGEARLDIGGRSVDLEDEGAQRRTMYGLVDRSNMPELYRIFDFANPDMSQARRFNTTVAQQALFFMNSPIAVEEARNIAARPEMASDGPDEEKLDYLYNLIYQRPPSTDEMKLGLQFIANQKGVNEDNSPHLAWEFGYGRYVADKRQFLNFRPLPGVSSKPTMYLRARGVSQKDIRAKKAKAYEIALSETGGYFANRTHRAATRRWTAPASGTISITGKMSGRASKGAELIAAVISSRHGELQRWKMDREETNADIPMIKVEAGETLDFVVSPTRRTELSSYAWSPVITMGEKAWNGKRDFSAAANRARAGGKPLNTWERLAQVMLFGNELIYLN